MNYKPEQNPEYVNNRIQEYIDTVMHPGCETGKDKWTIESMVSWERFGSSICRKCHANRERAHYLIRNEYMPAYDRECTLWLDRKTTQFKELPYKLRDKIEDIGMTLSNLLSESGISLFPHTAGWTAWDQESIFKAGQYVYSISTPEEHYIVGVYCKIKKSKDKVDTIIADWNAKVQKRKCDAMESRMAQMEAKLAELETRITELGQCKN